jgi:hypothetical protein
MLLDAISLQNTTTDFFANPIVGIIGTAASLIGVLLAIYFYLRGKRTRKLIYHVNSAKAIVVQAGQASRLKVSFDQKLIKSDITATQIAFWNRGNQSIKPNDVLKPIVISTENGVPILEANIRKTSREIIDIKLNEEENPGGRLGISWKILERNDGGVVQLIYAGSASVGIQVEGVIEGQKEIDELPAENFVSLGPIRKPLKAVGVALLILGSSMTVLSAVIITNLLTNGRFVLKRDWIGIIVPVYFLLAGLFFRRAKTPGPPFGYE